MGTLYFIIKNSIVTVIIVCLLQIQIAGKTFEERLMGFVQKTVAPKFLGTETTYVHENKLKMSPKDLSGIREKIYNNKMFDGVKKGAKDLFLKEMAEVIKESQEKKLKEFEKIDNLDKKK